MNLLKSIQGIFQSPPAEFKIVEFNKNNIPDITVKQIQNRDIDGIIVRNFIALNDCKLLVDRLTKKYKSEGLSLDTKYVFPTPFAQVGQNSGDLQSELQSYFNDSHSFVETFTDNFGFDILNELKIFIEKISPGSKLKLAPGTKTGNYTPATFRVLQPGKKNIGLHVGNQFVSQFKKYYEHLLSFVEVDDQMSYFIMLQEPDEGGRLILYDISWNEAKECNSPLNTITTLKGKTVDLNSNKIIGNRKLEIKVGDLLIFSAGQIWHAVEPPKGRTDRITFGGFLAFEKGGMGSDLYWWS